MITIVASALLSCVATRVVEVRYLPRDEQVHYKSEYNCIPDDYLVISKSKYEEDQEALIECEVQSENVDQPLK